MVSHGFEVVQAFVHPRYGQLLSSSAALQGVAASRHGGLMLPPCEKSGFGSANAPSRRTYGTFSKSSTAHKLMPEDMLANGLAKETGGSSGNSTDRLWSRGWFLGLALKAGCVFGLFFPWGWLISKQLGQTAGFGLSFYYQGAIFGIPMLESPPCG